MVETVASLVDVQLPAAEWQPVPRLKQPWLKVLVAMTEFKVASKTSTMIDAIKKQPSSVACSVDKELRPCYGTHLQPSISAHARIGCQTTGRLPTNDVLLRP